MDASLTTAWEKNPKQPNLGAESDRGGMMVAKDRGGNGLNGGHGEGGDDGDMRGWRRWRYEKVNEFKAAIPGHVVSKYVQEMAVLVVAGQSVRWKRPDLGSIKFNCDGAWNASTMHGGIGWVARDFAGLLQVAGGTGKLMFLSSIAAEAAAVRAAMGGCCESGLY
ncbi:hypothetical protein FF1_007035 [Malus domestica]